MRSLFWRVFATFWLAVVVAAALSALLGYLFNRDAWIVEHHPAIRGLARAWALEYEGSGPVAAQQLLERQRRAEHVDIQVLDEHGQPLVRGTAPPQALVRELLGGRGMEEGGGRERHMPPPLRRLTEEYVHPESGKTYLFIYRLPLPMLGWWRDSLLLPLGLLLIAVVVLTGFSLLLTLAITRPLARLRHAVHELGQTSLQKDSLQQLSGRCDEFGLLARDFSRMGGRLQELIASQRQLLHDVSHELRSPLARLRLALALASREGLPDSERERLWPRITRECDRLEQLISEILVLARVDSGNVSAQQIELQPLLEHLIEDAALLWPQRVVKLEGAVQQLIVGWDDLLERAIDNLLRNALRFSPAEQPVELTVALSADWLSISVADRGPGVSIEHLARLGEPFFRAPGQETPGHGLGLAIARRAAQRHDGLLVLDNRQGGGFIATLRIPRQRVVG